MFEFLQHIGMPRRSGRYPWGSGEDGNQRSIDFRSQVKELRGKGLSNTEIARGEGITTTQLRARIALEKHEARSAAVSEATKLKDKGYSTTEIGRRMDINESSVRSLLNPVISERGEVLKTTSNMLKESVDKNKYIDVGSGVENYVGVSRTKLNLAVKALEKEGYKIHTIHVEQVGVPGHFTRLKVLGAPDTKWVDLVKDPSLVQPIMAYSKDFGRSYNSVLGMKPIQFVDSKRVKVLYNDDGGSLKDGVIELRRGVKDLDLGKSRYAQVRIGVDGTHYMKGMAIYKDDMPKGIDIIYNTKKTRTDSKLDAMKQLADDIDNPIKSTIKPNGQKGALNIVNEEGDWNSWSKTISSQVLSKQTVPLAKAQLELAVKKRKEEFNEIMSLTNPVIKKKLLLDLGDSCDSASVHLKAAALPRQASKVILPILDLKPNEVYAPTFRDGEQVVLIRHPHGGKFEIPQVTVNNKSKAARAVMENARDSIGINPIVARKLSGADFDGDTVIVIPNNRGLIKTSASIKNLEDFDPISAYPAFPGMKRIKEVTKQVKMGEASNLITDMTIKGASIDEIARAVRYSMVVIDSEKHNLNYRQAFLDNGISSLSKKYQRSERGGASTLISRASAEIRVPFRKSIPTINPATGEKQYLEIDQKPFVNKRGKTMLRTTVSTQMAEARDAFALSSGRQIETVYANHANSLKALANDSRRIAVNLPPLKYNPSARVTYSREVDSLNAKLNVALKNSPIERQAQIFATSVIRRKVQNNPGLKTDNDAMKKIRNQALAEARTRTGAKKTLITIKPREWEAIQAGAITSSKLTQILKNADTDAVKVLATPRQVRAIAPARLSKARTLLASGNTLAQVAESLGVSVSTLNAALN